MSSQTSSVCLPPSPHNWKWHNGVSFLACATCVLLPPAATIARAFNVKNKPRCKTLLLLVTVISREAGHSVLRLLGRWGQTFCQSLFVRWVPSASDLASCSHTSQISVHAACTLSCRPSFLCVDPYLRFPYLSVCAGVWPKRVVPVVRQHGRGAPVRPSGAGHYLGRSDRRGRLGQPLHQVLQVPAVAWFWFMTVIDSGNRCFKFCRYLQ